MNNIFYEFLEKNKLGLSDAFDELPIYENMTITPGLPNTFPSPDDIIFYTVKFNYDNKSYRFNLNKKKNIQYMYLTGFANGENIAPDEQRKILSAILTSIKPQIAKTLTAKATAKHSSIALVNPKTGDDAKSYDAFNISILGREAGVLNKHLSTFFNRKGVVLDGDESESAENQSSQEQQKSQTTATASDSNDKKGNMGTETVQGATGSNKNEPVNSTGGKFDSSFKNQVEQEKKKIKKEKSAREVAVALMGREELIEKAKAEKVPFKRLQMILGSPHFKGVKDSLSYIIDAIKKLNNKSVFQKDYSTQLETKKVSYYKDIAKGPRNRDYSIELGIIRTNLSAILPLVKKHKLFANVNEILNAYSNKDDEKKAISWFYENHVNNHFTMKRIFNS